MTHATESRQCYTRVQIATALGVSYEHMERLLPAFSADSFSLARGGQPAWTISALPLPVRELLNRAVTRQRRQVRAVLGEPGRRWLTAVELVRLDVFHVNFAGALRSRIAPALIDCQELPLFGEDLVSEVTRHADQEKSFAAGEVESRFLRALIRRTIRRDANRHDWTRMELYLPSRPWSKSDHAAKVLVPTKGAFEYHQRCLDWEVERTLRGRQWWCIASEEWDALWLASFIDVRSAEVLQGRDTAKSQAELFAWNWGAYLVHRRVSHRRLSKLWLEHYAHWRQCGALMSQKEWRGAVSTITGRAK